MHTIVVGLDGSKGSLSALTFAIDEAKLRGAEITAVNCWHIPPIVYEVGWTAAPIDTSEFPKIAERGLAEALERAGAASSGVSVRPIVREGQAADVLCEVAVGADLLVVGSRGYGGFRGLLLGSVSQQCAQHARCPVVIIPRGQIEDDQEG